jgi:hypothetical protein
VNAWLKYDFGAGNEKDIVEFAVTAISVNANQPTNFALQFSDDDSTWTTTILILDQTGWGLSEQRVFNASDHLQLVAVQQARYWRIRCMPGWNQGEDYVGWSETHLRESIGGADATGSGTASASGEASGNVADNAFDGNTATQWMDALRTNNYLQYDFGAGVTKSIIEFVVQNRSDTAGYGPTLFILQFSTDGATWQSVYCSDIQSAWSLGESRVFQLTYYFPETLTVSRDCTTEFPEGMNGEAYEFSWDYPFSGVSLSITSGSLPPGLALENVSGSTYRIYGIPTTAGDYTFTIRATLIQEETSPPQDPIYTDREFSLTIGGEGGSSTVGICVAY